VQSANFTKELPAYTEKARDRVVDLIYRYDRTFGVTGPPRGKQESVSPTKSFIRWFLRPSPTPSPAAQPTPPVQETISSNSEQPTAADRQRIQAWVEKQVPNFEAQLPTFTAKLWDILKRSIGGFLGVTGFLLSLVMVPIYLFFFLKERPRIEQRWKDYLPLRDSPLKHEVAEVLLQINSYIIAYFRGQLLVCLVDGLLIGSILTLFGLNFAPLIGVMVGLLVSTWVFVFKKASARREAKLAEIAQMDKALGNLHKATAGIDDLNRKISELQKAIDFFASKLPQAKEMDKVLTDTMKTGSTLKTMVRLGVGAVRA